METGESASICTRYSVPGTRPRAARLADAATMVALLAFHSGATDAHEVVKSAVEASGPRINIRVFAAL